MTWPDCPRPCTCRICEHIRKIVDQAPPLTEEQKAKLTVILRSVQ